MFRSPLYHALAAISLALNLATPTQAQQTTPQPNAPGNFFTRFTHFYREDWHPTPANPSDPVSPPPARRGLPSPLDSPPFPNSDWSYGGAPTLGEADGNTYPFMAAIDHPNNRTKIYGWVSPTFNVSTSSKSNPPLANDPYSNRVELNQFVVYVERLPNSVQRDHFDFGYHFTSFFGTDYRYTTNKGYFSSQLLKDQRRYGFDPVFEYVDLYFPHVAKGMNLRAGRFLSIPGIEAQLAPNNYFFSHSLLYSIDPFTDTGVLATIQLSDQWLVQAGVSASHDTAPWVADARPAAMACVSYTTKSVDNNYYLCANGINDGKYAFNNLQQFDGTWYHKFSKTWHTATEAYVMYQRGVPAVGGPITPELGTNGAFCHFGQQTCFAPEYAIVNYLNKELNAHNFVGFRTDFLNDKKGQRTGTANRYYENTLALSHWVGTTLQLRPEIRFDHALDRPAYNSGVSQNQFTFASDLIVHF